MSGVKSSFEVVGDEVILKVNREIYSKEVVVQATYVLLEKFYFLIDCDESYWIVSLKVREDCDVELESSVYLFLDELIEAASYLDQMKNSSEIRQMILEKAILSQDVLNSESDDE